MKNFLRIPIWLWTLWLVATIAMVVIAYFAYPPDELRMTLLTSGLGLVAIVVLGAMGKFEKASKSPEDKT